MAYMQSDPVYDCLECGRIASVRYDSNNHAHCTYCHFPRTRGANGADAPQNVTSPQSVDEKCHSPAPGDASPEGSESGTRLAPLPGVETTMQEKADAADWIVALIIASEIDDGSREVDSELVFYREWVMDIIENVTDGDSLKA